ncbi:MAG: hypothetical protein WA020_04080 [Candidatus Acidiferrales bacterium]
MSPVVATIAFWIGILGLLWLDRDQESQTSWALWIPVAWFLLACSRSTAEWLYPAPPYAAVNSAQLLEGNPIDRFVYMGLLILGLIVLASRRTQVTPILRQNWPILLFFAYCAASFLWSDYPDVAFKRWNKGIGDFVMILIVWTETRPSAALKRLLARLTYILIPLSILLIKYYPALGRMYGRWNGTEYFTGVTTNKNSLGAICLLFGLGVVWRLFDIAGDHEDADRTRRAVAQCVVLAMIVWLFWHVNSMTALTCFVLAGGLLVATHLRSIIRRPSAMHFVIASIVLISAAFVFLDLSPATFAALGRNSTLTDRTGIWSLVLRLTRNPLVGTGYESFWLGPRLAKIWSIYQWGPNEAHDGYVEIFINLGWTGIILLGLVIISGYRTVISAWRRNLPTSSLRLAFFVVGMVYNFTEAAFFRMMAPVWMFFLFAITSVPEPEPLAVKEEAREGLVSSEVTCRWAQPVAPMAKERSI